MRELSCSEKIRNVARVLRKEGKEDLADQLEDISTGEMPPESLDICPEDAKYLGTKLGLVDDDDDLEVEDDEDKESAAKKHMRGPARLNKYYEKCIKGGGSKQYCSKIAWSIFCAYVDPSYEGCTEYGKKWGPPYSGPLSK